ncbi:hypothetical protein NDU88_010332 [Pleurodeles waltl]|uniref:Uncharacterized protein n=1 Tax=Pleurodeles waltl TaxID=8319 RepID=A0AAV7S110_PLEWA|nr:hypothetical protein NDU88_010332 [Pleurodeles waltl]
MHRELMWGAQYPEGTLSAPRWLRPLRTAPHVSSAPSLAWRCRYPLHSYLLQCLIWLTFPRVSGPNSWIQEGVMGPQAVKGWGRTPCTFMRRPLASGRAQAASVTSLTFSNACPAHRPRQPRAWVPTPGRSLLAGIARGRNFVLPLATPQGSAGSAGPMRLKSGSTHPRNATSGSGSARASPAAPRSLSMSPSAVRSHARAALGPRPVP